MAKWLRELLVKLRKMEVTAQSTFIRQTPRKLRLVANEIRGLKALEAEIILKNLNKAAAQPLLKVLRQAMANAENNFQLDKTGLKIKKLEIGEGPRMKRYRFVAKGRVHQVIKRMGHIKMVLEDQGKEAVEKKTVAKKIAKKKGKDGTKS